MSHGSHYFFSMISEMCNSVLCKYGARCRNGECVCPFLCPHDYEPVCGTDGRTYHNQCEMEKHGCQQNKDIDALHTGECAEDPLESIGSGGRLDSVGWVSGLPGL